MSSHAAGRRPFVVVPWEHDFLQALADTLIRDHAPDLDQVLLIFPHARPARYLRRILAARPDRIVPKEELVEQLFNFDQEASPNAVEQFVARLRRKLADASVEIRTLRGLGYQLAVL